MVVLFLAGVLTAYWSEARGNPLLAGAGVDQTVSTAQSGGNMEGKGVRFGIANSALFATATTDASCGAVNSTHDSFTPLGGLVPLVNIMLGEVIFGGVQISIGGTQSATGTTGPDGRYSFINFAQGGNYTVTPSKSDILLTYSFSPPSYSYTNISANQVADFVATASLVNALNPVADAYVQDGTAANTNFGAAATLGVRTDSTANSGNNRDAYMRFDLSSVTKNIISAKLRVYAALSAAGSVATSAYSVSSTTWAESGTGGITWNNKPARSATALTGATATVNGTTHAAYDIDVTAYVKGEKSAGRDLVSLALHNPTATTINTTLNSREASANRPQLLVSTNTSNAAPAVSLTAPVNGSGFTAPANITVGANASDADGSVAKVEFYAGTAPIGTATASPYQVTWGNVAAGSYQLTAVATDNLGAATRSAAVAVTVGPANVLPSVSMASPADGSSFAAGSNVVVSANAGDADGTVSKVEFFAGTTLIGTATTPASGSLYSVTWANVNPGGYAVTAKATDNAGGSTTSPAVNVNVVSQTGLSPTADAYVKDGTSATANFGTATDLQAQVSSTAGNNRETYLKYDLTSVSGVTQAKVRLYGRLNDTSASNVTAAIYSVATTSWTETGTAVGRSYDGLGRTQSITTTPAADAAQSYTYTYNNLSQRTRVTREDGSYWAYEYDDRDELTSGKKFWADNTPVFGAQTEYAFDNIGNRTSSRAGGNTLGALRQSVYTANALNQYTQRTVPGAADVTGTANAAATVSVNNEPTARRGDYFYKEMPVNNAAGPVYAQVNVVGARNNFGAGGEDAVTERGGRVYVPQAVEAYSYDADGNLTADGRWNYTWDAENRLTSMEARPNVPGRRGSVLSSPTTGRAVASRSRSTRGTR